MKKKSLALLPLIALRLTGCDLGGNNIPVSAEKGDKGDKGDIGPQGPKGDKGDSGIDGKDGESLLTGKGTPSSSLGKDGDSYVDTQTWDYYTKEDGKWTKAGNFKGGQGDVGLKGDTGATGPKGDKGDTGSKGDQGLKGNKGDKGDKGDQGIKGDQGQKGDKGDDGIAGKDGESLLTGKGEPSSDLGKDGDSYVDTETWDYYTKADGKWTKAGNFKGNKGDKGDTGSQGETGPKGDKGDTGSKGDTGATGPKGDKGDDGIDGKDGESLLTGKGVPSSELGKDGDSYVDTQTWDYYTKAEGKWTKAGNFKGNKGDKGDTGATGPKGDTGAKGDKGDTGLQGPKGDKGDAGAKGDDAITYVPCIFKNYDGTTIYEFYYERGSDIVYDGPTPVKKEKDEEGKDIPWTFVGWDKSLENIQKPTIFTAKFECLYTCTFLNYDGSALYSAKVNRGENVSYEGDTPLKPDTVDGETTIHWTFTGWDKDLTDIKADTIFTAQFDSPNAIKCTFVNYDGTLLGYSYCGKGGKAVYEGDTPTKQGTESEGVITGYRFSGWDKQQTNIHESATFTAQYETYTSYECKFVNYDGTLLYSMTVVSNGAASYKGYTPLHDFEIGEKNKDGTTNVVSYSFKGWDKNLTGITAPTTFTAIYHSISYSGYRVEFRNKDGSEIYHTYTKKGENAACSYERIKNLISSSYSYDSENVTMFAGWNQSTSDVRSNLVLTANIATISRKRNGEYPQTQVEDDKLISKLNSITQTDAQGYVSYGGEKYKKCKDYYYFYCWRKVEPIQWRYLSQNGDNVQFVSEKVLNHQVWNKTEHEDGINLNNYKYSDIRKWLNSDFLEQAFYYDSSLIQTVNVDNSSESTGNSSNRYACEDTRDKVYLLSYKDITNEDYGFTDDASRIAYDADGEAQDYWLRSPLGSDSARCAEYNGYVYRGSGIGEGSGVRPRFDEEARLKGEQS